MFTTMSGQSQQQPAKCSGQIGRLTRYILESLLKLNINKYISYRGRLNAISEQQNKIFTPTALGQM